jgi:hypothetical protein
MKCAIGGCNGTPTALATAVTSSPTPYDIGLIAVGGGNIFWSEELGVSDAGIPLDEVVACATGGCAGSPTPLGPGAEAIATDNQSVFWTDDGVFECAIGGCNGVPTSFGAYENLYGIAVDATNVYFVTFGLWTCPKAGCGQGPTNLVTSSEIFYGFGSFALDTDQVYVMTEYFDSNQMADLGAIVSCPKTGCPSGPTTVITGLHGATAVATDGENVYWIEDGNSDACGSVTGNRARIARCSVNGCNNQPTTLAAQLTNPVALAVDNQNVYWVDMGTTGTDGEAWQIPK